MRTTAVVLPLLALGTSGCLLHPAHNTGIHAVEETRDRVLLLEEQPSRLGSSDAERSSVEFRPMAALNVGFEELAADGFVLRDANPAKDGTRFRFERKITEKYKPTNAPMELTGMFELDLADTGGGSIHYVLDPRPKGYRVHIMGEGADDEGGLALWDGEVVRWRHGDEENTIELSPDGRSIIHVRTTRTPPGEPLSSSRVVEAFRVSAE